MAGNWGALADWSRAQRDRLGWTQSDLAKEAGVSLKTVTDLESGRDRTRFNKLPAIERAFGVGAGTARKVLQGSSTQADTPPPDAQTTYLRPLDYLREGVLRDVTSRKEQLRLLAMIDAKERELLAEMEEEIRRANERDSA